MTDVFILGGHQTDFAVNWARRGEGLFEMLCDAVDGAIAAADIDASEIEAAHVGNFVGELFAGQGHLGGMFASIRPEFSGVPAARHEAACASGSMAVLAATAEIEAGRYDLACVVGVEQMRNVGGQEAAEHLGAALWVGAEATDARFPWPHQFSDIAAEYANRYGIEPEHLLAIARKNFANARSNPLAQSRSWVFEDAAFTLDDAANPVIEGRIRKQDCGRITDGAAAVLLASPRFAREWAERRGTSLEGVPRIEGWGHHTAPMRLADKLAASRSAPYVFPHVRTTITDAWRRAGIGGIDQIDAIETHDCFTITEYMAIDHFGITEPGASWQAIEDETTTTGGATPMNASGGLIGAGHPVGATGVRMLVDAHRQVTGTAGDMQVAGTQRVQTLNIGGSATTVASFVVGCG